MDNPCSQSSTVIATVIATIISSLVALILYLLKESRDKKREKKKSIIEREMFVKQQLDSILNIAIKYPYLEDTNFISTWDENKNSTDEKYIRYDLYCTLIFNYLERMWNLFEGNEKDINDFIDVKTLVTPHKRYWINPPTPYENQDGYLKEFRNFIYQYIK